MCVTFVHCANVTLMDIPVSVLLPAENNVHGLVSKSTLSNRPICALLDVDTDGHPMSEAAQMHAFQIYAPCDAASHCHVGHPSNGDAFI